MEKLLQDILKPSEEFTPIPFWFFNDEPDEEKIKAQLQDYAEKGVHGFVLHPRIGVPKSVPYLSEAYFKAVRFIVKTAAQLHMKVVLYDEGMYPSGSAHGMVVAANPEFASRGIKLIAEEELPGERAGYQEMLRAGQTAGDAGSRNFGEPEIVTRFADGKCLLYTFTGGNIRGIHFGEDDGEAGAPASADILNPDAVDLFIHLTHDKYYEELKEYFGSTVIAFFTDEPSALGRNAGGFREWLPGMEKELTAAGGNLEELEALFTGQENKTTVIYHKLVKKYLREIFYARLSRWCEAHGIVLMGHPEASDDVEEELYFQIPGQDLIMRRVSPESGGLLEFDSVQAKLPADIARHLGRRRNANECFGVCCRENISWYFTAGDMKWYIDWLGMRGVNLFVPHAFYYSVAGKRKEERPPDVGPNNIWWPYYRRFSDYMKRLSFLMTDSCREAKVAVLCDNNKVPYREIACLYENQVDFHYLPVAFLKDAKTEDGKLRLGEYLYDVVLNVLGDAAKLPQALRQKEREARNGSAASDEMLQEEAGTEACLSVVTDAESLLKDERLRTVVTDAYCPALRAVSLTREGGKRMYLFSNEGDAELSVRVRLPETELISVDLWRGEAWREPALQSGDGFSDAHRTFSLQLQPCETRLVLLDYDGKLAEKVPLRQEETDLGDLTEQFILQEKSENRAVYSLKLKKEQVTENETFLVKGQEMAECFCNGQLADVSFLSPHKIRIGSYLQPGENEITLVMTGNAANIYCGADIPYGL